MTLCRPGIYANTVIPELLVTKIMKLSIQVQSLFYFNLLLLLFIYYVIIYYYYFIYISFINIIMAKNPFTTHGG